MLLATDFLSGRWLADERTQMLRRVTMRRAHLMRQCIRAKNQIHSVLHRSLLPARL
ncbi:hypothetical protein ACIRD9_40720 [Streptomyces violaceus]|uniref:hypothetical protein n=1 Tax=Streptomyces violaceus TaxID=1936 RepID=UPI0037FFE294